MAGSALALTLAPLAVADSYSPIEHSVSEAASQGTSGAWVGRTTFLLFGLGVLGVTRLAGRQWNTLGRAAHTVFAVGQFAVAAYAARTWLPVTTFDTTEDQLHSVAATVIGFAFAIGVAAVSFNRRPRRPRTHLFDAVAVSTAIAIPLAMLATPAVSGALQRVMFAITYLWYSRELLQRAGTPKGRA